MIGKYLDLSVAHFTVKTLEALYTGDGNVTDVISYPKYDKEAKETFGAFVHVPDDLDECKMPRDLKKVLEYAQKKGCYWLQIDRDAEVIPDLPVYNTA